MELAIEHLVALGQVRGITIPDDISVVSLLTALEYKAACNPPLTVVSTPASVLGRLGVRTLLRRLEASRRQSRCCAPEFSSRGSPPGPRRRGDLPDGE
jgi:DNA-binding LacI/PurR family transcriptional regulator